MQVLITGIVTGIFVLCLVFTLFLNIRKTKLNQERSAFLKLGTLTVVCFAVSCTYYLYWTINSDIVRQRLMPFFAIQAAVVFSVSFISAKRAHKSLNLPGAIRLSLLTFVFMHMVLPAVVKNDAKMYVLGKLFADEVVAVICATIAVFLFAVNSIMIVVQLIMFFRAKKI